jgi:hypothetical protein
MVARMVRIRIHDGCFGATLLSCVSGGDPDEGRTPGVDVFRVWGRAALCAALTMAGITLAQGPSEGAIRTPSGVSSADESDGFTSWQIHVEPDNPVAPAGDYDYDSASLNVSAPSPYQPVTMSVASPTEGNDWVATFRGKPSYSLEPGQTFSADDQHPFTGQEAPSIQVNRGVGCPTVGSFTVHDASYDGAGRFRLFSATFSLRCVGHSGWLTGSIGWRLDQPARPVPPTPDEVQTPRPVQNLAVHPWVGGGSLSWVDAGDPNADGDVVCPQEGTTAMTQPSFYCLESMHGTGTGTGTYFSTGIGWLKSFVTWSVWPIDIWGNLGPERHITTRGTQTTMATDPSQDDATPGLRLAGQLTDGPTGVPLAQQRVEIHAYRQLPPGVWSPDHNGYLDELVAVITTDAHGSFARTFPLRPGWSYQARYFGLGTRIGNLSKLVPADGSTYIDLDAKSPASGRSRLVSLVSRVTTVHRGDRVLFQRMKSGHWKTMATRGVGASRVVAVRTRVAKRTKRVFRAVLRAAVNGSVHASFPVRVRGR